MSEKCTHCNRCKAGCTNVCACCGKCNTCGQQAGPVVAPAPVFVSYPVYPTPIYPPYQPNPMPIDIGPVWIGDMTPGFGPHSSTITLGPEWADRAACAAPPPVGFIGTFGGGVSSSSSH